MTVGMSEQKTVVLLVSAASGALEVVPHVVQPLLDAGRRVAITFTSNAAAWFSDQQIAELAELTGLPVRSGPRMPDQPSPHPVPACVVMAPATANTVAKLATGICDSQALTTANQYLTSDKPFLIFPQVHMGHVRHPAWDDHIRRLQSTGAYIVNSPEHWKMREPDHTWVERPFPWQHIVDWALEA